MSVHGRMVGTTSFETDKARFLGRGVALQSAGDGSSGSAFQQRGPVLDPIVAIRSTLTIEPGETAVIDIVSGAAETREGVGSGSRNIMIDIWPIG